VFGFSFADAPSFLAGGEVFFEAGVDAFEAVVFVLLLVADW
jgi:hypothetical protein